MTNRVPYLTEERVERDSMDLLAEYGKAFGAIVVAPVPIEDIVERHLKLRIEFSDLHSLFDHQRSSSDSEADILGAMFFDERRSPIGRDVGRNSVDEPLRVRV